jgi:hypothetical protein
MKPVAWMIIDVDNGKSLQSKESKFSEINIPLYTAPRELTDEEIYKIYCEVEDTKCPSDDFEYMVFARAILKKASEK